MKEEIIDPQIPIIDPHHHLWDLAPDIISADHNAHPFSTIPQLTPRYMFEELLADCRSAGHNVIGTVFMQSGVFYDVEAAEAMKPVGEVKFVTGVAARSANGSYGDFRACAGIVGHADLMLGDRIFSVLEAEIAAGNGHFKGIRHIGAHDNDPSVLGPLSFTPPGLYADADFRSGFAQLAPLGLTFDAWVLEPQICEVTSLARAFPGQSIILDHVGTPLGLGQYAGHLSERFAPWRDAIRELATCPNVNVKIGGLAMPFCGFDGIGPEDRQPSWALAELWRPYVDTCIEAFGAARCMFESNYPVERWGADYGTLWNAFKRLASAASDTERSDLFSGTAIRVYGLENLL